ncbi:hypothetical protein ACJX0J_014690 [Zea mays]
MDYFDCLNGLHHVVAHLIFFIEINLLDMFFLSTFVKLCFLKAIERWVIALVASEIIVKVEASSLGFLLVYSINGLGSGLFESQILILFIMQLKLSISSRNMFTSISILLAASMFLVDLRRTIRLFCLWLDSLLLYLLYSLMLEKKICV